MQTIELNHNEFLNIKSLANKANVKIDVKIKQGIFFVTATITFLTQLGYN